VLVLVRLAVRGHLLRRRLLPAPFRRRRRRHRLLLLLLLLLCLLSSVPLSADRMGVDHVAVSQSQITHRSASARGLGRTRRKMKLK
jgi:hypothetical protein